MDSTPPHQVSHLCVIPTCPGAPIVQKTRRPQHKLGQLTKARKCLASLYPDTERAAMPKPANPVYTSTNSDTPGGIANLLSGLALTSRHA